MEGHVLRVTFEPCRLYDDGRVREKSGGGGGGMFPTPMGSSDCLLSA